MIARRAFAIAAPGAGAISTGGVTLPSPWLETLRITMREFSPGDLDDLHALDSDPLVMRYTSGVPMTRDETIVNLRRMIRYPTLYPDLGLWHASRRDTGVFIGWFCLKYCSTSAAVEVGYRLLRDQWGLGFATEGATALVQFGFDDLGLHRIIGVTHPDNAASQRVLVKAGLADEGWAHYYDKRVRLFAADNPHRQA